MYWISGINSAWYGTEPFFFPLFFVGWILFLGFGLFAFFVFFRLRNRFGCGYGWYGGARYGSQGNTEDILNTRLARGDITLEEYDELVRRIGKR